MNLKHIDSNLKGYPKTRRILYTLISIVGGAMIFVSAGVVKGVIVTYQGLKITGIIGATLGGFVGIPVIEDIIEHN